MGERTYGYVCGGPARERKEEKFTNIQYPKHRNEAMIGGVN